jgi:hypothetical protein
LTTAASATSSVRDAWCNAQRNTKAQRIQNRRVDVAARDGVSDAVQLGRGIRRNCSWLRPRRQQGINVGHPVIHRKRPEAPVKPVVRDRSMLDEDLAAGILHWRPCHQVAENGDDAISTSLNSPELVVVDPGHAELVEPLLPNHALSVCEFLGELRVDREERDAAVF